MKPATLMLFTVLLYINYTDAQTTQWIVKPGENINTALPSNARFHYGKFTPGTVFFRDGTQSNASLDYNLLSGEMQFIAPAGDTLAVANEATIKYIAIGTDTFIYDKIYLQVISGNNTAKLAKKEALGIGDVKKAGAYDQYSSTSSITTVTSVRLQDRVTNLTQQQELLVLKQTTYYIGNTYNHFLLVNKKNVMKLFGNKQNAIEQYFKDNKVAFNKEEDLKALIAFLNQ